MPSDQAFCVHALLEWGSMGDFQKAGGGPEIKDIVSRLLLGLKAYMADRCRNADGRCQELFGQGAYVSDW